MQPIRTSPVDLIDDQDVLNVFPATGEYGDPDVSSMAERESFLLQVKFVNQSKEPENTERVRAEMERLFEPARWTWRTVNVSRLLEVVRNVNTGENRKKSPGVPLCHMFQTNGDVIDHYGEAGIVKLVAHRLNAYRRALPGQQVMDPIRVFVKREPHKVSKIKEKRWRLIWSMGLIDRLVNDLLFGDLAKAEIANFDEIPSQPGLGFFEGNWDRLAHRLIGNPPCERFAAMDISGWDMSVPGWGYDAYLDGVFRRCKNKGDICKEDEAAMRHVFWNVSQCRVRFSDGTEIEQSFRGICKSGWALTISFNCWLRAYVQKCSKIRRHGHFNDQTDFIVTMGDDSLERAPNEDIDAMIKDFNSWGFRVKGEAQVGPLDKMEFCGSGFRLNKDFNRWVWIANPTHFDKHVRNLQRKEKGSNTAQQLESFLQLYAFDDVMFDKLEKLLIKKGDSSVKVKSRLAYQSHHLGVE